MIHELKIRSEYFQAIINGTKTFEIRKNDRNYCVGDILILQEINDKNKFTSRVIRVKVIYLTDYEQKDNYIVMSITRELTKFEKLKGKI
ncbi:MAG: DUF3850 domain-containing protein [Streptococcaceae bacterium]|jgi:ASC-1-like (ASCH) protein|nr:DUF3850 domain-containing protein [Streptococcaceae bacterium]